MEHILFKISIILAPALMAVTLHELAHGVVADKFGDPTARLLGRLTLNPLRHLDPIGTIAVLFFGFGWARPVPVNANNLRHPRRDMIWVTLSGPLTNLGMALLSALLLRLLHWLQQGLPASAAGASLLLDPLLLMSACSLYINVILGIFNLLPLPPLDGGRVLMSLLPEPQALRLARLEPFGLLLLVFLVFFTRLWESVLYPVILSVVGLLAGPQFGVVRQVISYLLAQ